MSWTNSDGLYVKFGTEETAVARGAEYTNDIGQHVIEFVVDYTDALSATASILGSASGTETGSYGVMVPKNLFIEAVETFVETAFTSSGTIGTSTLVMGLIRDDRSTTYDVDGLTTASWTGGNLDAAGERVYLVVGGTGAGALIGTELANDGLIVVANSQHASHPFTAGSVRVRVIGHFKD